ncbi:MAG: AgmX/PglI C-terminal domain-containing protein [Deltaproteobacteria bacterium]|nr:AgmX/PglI C-terminal domain-containing protein [Deltaproteobacteria bacterium]MBW2421121.1 AgmX/PglI C-terminal domain-containing protein [Deltaproteobacteria bacterium]
MNTASSQHEEALRAQLRQAREKLDGLLGDLHAVDAEIEDLATDREQYRLLQEVCAGLEKLDALGGAGLFWNGQASRIDVEGHLRAVRTRADDFERRVRDIESGRQTVLDQIERAQEDSDYIAGDVLDVEREKEERKRDWVVERDVDSLPGRELVMPWSRAGQDDDRFRKSMAASLLLSLMLGWLLPLIDLPIPERWEMIEIPDRFTQLLKEKQPLAPPVVQETQPREVEPQAVEEETPLLAEEVVPAPAGQPAEKPDMKSTGILAFREKFSGLAESEPTARLGSQARIDRSGELASGRPQRSMVTTQAPGSSGGINVAELSRGNGGGGGQEIEGVQITRATSTIGSGSGGDRPLAGGGPGLSRTDEEIQIVFDRHKAALYRLYNRELRKNPTLKGQMVLRMTIEPDGSVSFCEVKSTDMKTPLLSSQVVERVETFDFGAKEGIPAITILYPIDFLPAA